VVPELEPELLPVLGELLEGLELDGLLLEPDDDPDMPDDEPEELLPEVPPLAPLDDPDLLK
jgi:hypothetical protein